MTKEQKIIEKYRETVEAQNKAMHQLCEERDGLRMRVQALDSKANALTKQCEVRANLARDLAAQAQAYQTVALRVVGLTIDKSFKKGQESGVSAGAAMAAQAPEVEAQEE